MVDQTLDRATNSIAVAKAAAQDARELAVARVALDDEALAEVELAGLCDFALALAATEQEGRRLADGPEVRGRDVERYCAGGARARACWAEAGRERLGRVLLQVNAVGAEERVAVDVVVVVDDGGRAVWGRSGEESAVAREGLWGRRWRWCCDLEGAVSR